MTVTATVVKDKTDPNGRRRLWVEYTHVETGTKHWGGVIRAPQGQDMTGYLADKATKVEAALAEQELTYHIHKAEDLELDPDDFPVVYNTRRKVRRRLVRRMFNAVAQGEYVRAIRIGRKIRGRISIGTLTEFSGWSEADTQSAWDAITTLIDAADAADHGRGEMQEDG